MSKLEAPKVHEGDERCLRNGLIIAYFLLLFFWGRFPCLFFATSAPRLSVWLIRVRCMLFFLRFSVRVVFGFPAGGVFLK